jgi:hypothetical protein
LGALSFWEDAMRKEAAERALEGFEALEGFKLEDDKRIAETLHLLDMGRCVCDNLYGSGADEKQIFAGHSIIFQRAIEDLMELKTFYDQVKAIEKKVLAA